MEGEEGAREIFVLRRSRPVEYRRPRVHTEDTTIWGHTEQLRGKTSQPSSLLPSSTTNSMRILKRTTAALKEVYWCDDMNRRIQPIHGFERA